MATSASGNRARRIGTVDDMAGAVMCTMTSTFMTGLMLPVGRGETLI